jgi:hypothetical protein
MESNGQNTFGMNFLSVLDPELEFYAHTPYIKYFFASLVSLVGSASAL